MTSAPVEAAASRRPQSWPVPLDDPTVPDTTALLKTSSSALPTGLRTIASLQGTRAERSVRLMAITPDSTREAERFRDWTPELLAELEANSWNPESARACCWRTHAPVCGAIRLAPGERTGFTGRSSTASGRASAAVARGATRATAARTRSAPTSARRAPSRSVADSMIHDLENSGSADFAFTTFEFLDSANDPTPNPSGEPR